VRKLIDFDDDTFDKLKQLSRDRMATVQELADEAFADLLKKARHTHRPEGCAAQERIASEDGGAQERKIESIEETEIMTTDPDPFEEGQRAAQENIPAEGNPYWDGSEEHSLWAAGHERVAGAAEADESEGT